MQCAEQRRRQDKVNRQESHTGAGEEMNTLSKGEQVAIILDDGERVLESISEACSRAGISSGMIVSGIGMIRDAKIGYWNGKMYVVDSFSEPAELLSMHGSIAIDDGKLSLHIHVNLSGIDHKSFGGHLVGATVNNVNEICVTKFHSGSFRREFNAKTGLPALTICQS